MATVLFWNIARQNLTAEIAAIAKDQEVDLIALAEVEFKGEELRRALAREMPDVPFEEPRIKLCPAISLWVRHSSSFWSPVSEGRRFSIGEFCLPARKRILVAAAHLKSRLHSNEQSLNEECRSFAERIRGAETWKLHLRPP